MKVKAKKVGRFNKRWRREGGIFSALSKNTNNWPEKLCKLFNIYYQGY